jgi:hypothetical protein
MKRILLVAVLISIVAGVIFAGLAYAAPSSTTSTKLVGLGLVGYSDSTVDRGYETRIVITNPNTVSTINIDRVRIYNTGGDIVYEEDFFLNIFGSEEVTTLPPHKMVGARLSLWTGGENNAPQSYTVEIFWSGGRNVLPLMGKISQYYTTTWEDGQITEAIGELAMENMAAN